MVGLSPKDTLCTLNRLAQTHFAQCTLHDWLMTCCLLEIQTHEPLPWYPHKRTSPNSPEEDIVVSDIYRVLHHTVCKKHKDRSSALSLDSAIGTISSIGGSLAAHPTKTSLWESLPNPIKVLLDLHRIVRHWIIQQISDPTISIGDRVERIQKFIQIIYLCRFNKESSGSHAFKEALDGYLSRAKSLPILNNLDLPESVRPDGKGGPKNSRPSHYVPSFVERAIASGLVSPESRRFIRAWNLVAFENGTNLDTLDALLQFPQYPSMFLDATSPNSNKSASPNDSERPWDVNMSDCTVPCVGWLLENMISLCYDTPDRLPDDVRLINIAQRQRMFMLVSICDQLVVRCQKSFYSFHATPPGFDTACRIYTEGTFELRRNSQSCYHGKH